MNEKLQIAVNKMLIAIEKRNEYNKIHSDGEERNAKLEVSKQYKIDLLEFAASGLPLFELNDTEPDYRRLALKIRSYYGINEGHKDSVFMEIMSDLNIEWHNQLLKEYSDEFNCIQTNGSNQEIKQMSKNTSFSELKKFIPSKEVIEELDISHITSLFNEEKVVAFFKQHKDLGNKEMSELLNKKCIRTKRGYRWTASNINSFRSRAVNSSTSKTKRVSESVAEKLTPREILFEDVLLKTNSEEVVKKIITSLIKEEKETPALRNILLKIAKGQITELAQLVYVDLCAI